MNRIQNQDLIIRTSLPGSVSYGRVLRLSHSATLHKGTTVRSGVTTEPREPETEGRVSRDSLRGLHSSLNPHPVSREVRA